MTPWRFCVHFYGQIQVLREKIGLNANILMLQEGEDQLHDIVDKYNYAPHQCDVLSTGAFSAEQAWEWQHWIARSIDTKCGLK